MTKAELLQLELIEGILANVLVRVLPLALQLLWRKRMSPRRRSRIWVRAQWALLIWQFGPITMIPFAWITRKNRSVWESVLSLLLGAVGFALCAAVTFGVLAAFESATGMPDEDERRPPPASGIQIERPQQR